MATKGVLIDYKNPEKYYCLKFGWVKRIKYIEESQDEEASLLVFFKKHEVAYSLDGFFIPGNKSPSMDLLLVKDMEKIPYEHRKRKVIQISSGITSDQFDITQTLYALCDDGKIYAWVASNWQEWPEIPQD